MPKGEGLLKEVFLRYHGALYGFGMKIIADEYIVEECIQELFLYIYEKEIDLAKIEHLKAYLFTAFRRRILSKKKELEHHTSFASLTEVSFEKEEFLLPKEEQATAVAELLNKLPWRQREAVYLKFFNKLTGKEIAEIMGIKPQVVANTIYKALKKLRTMKPIF